MMIGKITLLLFVAAEGLKVPETNVRTMKGWSKAAASSILAAAALISPIGSRALAVEKRSVASIAGSGFLFKDKLNVDAYADPRIDGIYIYLSDFEIPGIEKVGKFFADPSQAGLSCVRQVTPLTIKSPLPIGSNGEEIVSESRSVLGQKTIKINRIYDEKANAVIYAV